MLKTRNFYRVISGAFFALCMVFGSASAWAVDCAVGYYLPANTSICKPCPAGKYCSVAGSYSTSTSDQGIKGNVNAGFFATCGATKASPNTTVGGVAGDDSNGCLSGCTCGKINIGYYSNGGTRKASPSAGDCISGKTCGKCLSGFTTASGGQTTPTACYQTQSAGVSCNTVFPYNKMNSGATVTYNSSANTAVSTRRYQTSATTVGEWQTADTSGSCVVTNFSCSSSNSISGSSLQIGTVKAYGNGAYSISYNSYGLGVNQVMVDYTNFKVYGQTINSDAYLGIQYGTQSGKPAVNSSGAYCWLRIIAVESSSGVVYTSSSTPWIYLGQVANNNCAYGASQELQTNNTVKNFVTSYTYYTCSKSSVTCAAGKYLAKEATSCSNCPAGQYCEGGTFYPSNSDRGITGYVSAGYYSTGSASSPTPNLIGAGYYGDVGATASTGTGVVAAGYYSSNGGTSSTPDSNGSGCVGTSSSCGKVSAGFYSTGGGKSSSPTAGCMSGYSCGTISAGYWGEAGATSSTGSGPVAAGYYSTGAGTSATGDCVGLGTCGLISANYYSTGGATKSTPSSSDCVGSNTCGACISGFTTNGATGSKSYTACKKSSTMNCSSVFPVTVGYPWTNIVYTSDDNPQYTTNYSPNSANAHTTTACTISQTSTTGSGSCKVDDPSQCFVRGISCASNFHLWIGSVSGTSDEQEWTTGTGSDTSVYGNNVSWEEATNPGIGTFYVPFNNGIKVRGIWMKANLSTGYHYNSNGTYCVCQIQTIEKADGKSYPVTSTWTDASGSGYCYTNCIEKFSTTASIFSQFTNVYPFKCLPDSYTVVLDGNSASSGNIAGQSATAGHPVSASCSADKIIGTQVVPWNSSGSGTTTTNITKTVSGSSKIFIGWGESANSTSTTTKTCTPANLVNESTGGTYNTYYAVWKAPTCDGTTNSTKVQNVSVSSVTENKVVCNRQNKAGYYCPTTQIGNNMQDTVVVDCSACKSNWTSTAGAATTEANCTRTIVLNKNGGNGTVTVGSANYTGTTNAAITCNYDTACSFPATTGLSKTGYSFTGKWSTSSTCSDGGSTAPRITATGSSVVYYACTTANNITITWTGVSSIPSSGFTTISNDTTTSTVAYNGNITTPSGAIVATAGQTFLGWKFSN